MNKSIAQRNSSMSYDNFNVAVYCPVASINRIEDFEEYDRRFRFLSDNIRIGRVYLESYRGGTWCTREQMKRVKDYFLSKGIAVSGGVTTSARGTGEGYASLCYSSEEDMATLAEAVRICAELFDEMIFDDFYFANCRCEKCIEAKGDRSWSDFRLEQKRRATEEIVMKTAKSVNPDMNVIIKYPQWYDSYRETGYDIITEPQLFDSIYTGTETRNPTYSQQHLPKYLSYFIMRYLESAAPERNLGGWFDPYECSYNLTSYLEQGYLTLFGKAREVTLFCSGSLMLDPAYRTFPAAVGELFREVDSYISQLGKPCGAVAYRPADAVGEDNLHNYLGMCGIPFDASVTYPADARAVFLSEGAAADPDITAKMKASLLAGTDVIVTSGFIRRMGRAFSDEFVNVTYSPRKALVSEYAGTRDNGLSISGCCTGKKPVLIPQLDYFTNDVWELAGAYGTDNNFPIVLRCLYGKGHISVITIPDNAGDLCNYPVPVLDVMRGLFCTGLPLRLSAPAGVMLFAYDNDTFILRSDLPYDESVTVTFDEDVVGVYSITYGRDFPLDGHRAELRLAPGVNYVCRLLRK